jgi:RNA polymerase sigma-70 factor (ECF subfamily)
MTSSPIPRTEDHALLARVCEQDRVALELLYRRHAHWVTARLQARCRDADIVDLAVQDTFLAVWRSAKKFRGDGEVGAWIWGIAIRRLVDQLRKRRPTPVDPSTITHASVDGGYDDALGGGDAHDALNELAPELRAAMIATAIDGLTTKEAAHLLGVPQGTVKTRLMRAREQLRRGQLGDDIGLHPERTER